MNIHTKTTTDPATAVSPAEWQVRVDLAAVYRLVAHHGWDDGIWPRANERNQQICSKKRYRSHFRDC